MRQNATSFRLGVLKRQIFNRLLNFYFQRKLKNSRAHVAQQFYKKITMNRWLNAKFRVQMIRGEIINSTMKSEYTASFKQLNVNLKKSLEVV